MAARTALGSRRVNLARATTRPSLGGWLAPSYVGASSTLSLAEQIADTIAAGIVRGEHAPGSRLQELGLAAAFGVSRGPVRDALKLLHREGLVDLQARRGATVQVLSRKDVVEIFEIRAVLYGLAGETIARRAEPAVLAALDASVEDLHAALGGRDPEAFLDAIYQKSMFFADTCGSDLLRSMIYMRGRQTLSLTQRAMVVPVNQAAWVANWQALVERIRAGDAPGADAAGRHLVRHVEGLVVAFFDGAPSDGRAPRRLGPHIAARPRPRTPFNPIEEETS